VIKINLAPPLTGKPQGLSVAGINLGLVFGALGLLAVVALGSWWTLSTRVWGLRTEIRDNQKELDRLKPIIARTALSAGEAGTERRVAAIEMVARNQARPTYLLDTPSTCCRPTSGSTGRGESQQIKLAGTTYLPWRWRTMTNLKASGTRRGPGRVTPDLGKSPRTITRSVVPVRDLSHGIPRSIWSAPRAQKIVAGVIGLAVLGGLGYFSSRRRRRGAVCGTRTRDWVESARPPPTGQPSTVRARAEALRKRLQAARASAVGEGNARALPTAQHVGLAVGIAAPSSLKASPRSGGRRRRADRDVVARATTISSARSSLA
jgi:hypothetical protein